MKASEKKSLNHLGKVWVGPPPYVIYCQVDPARDNGLKTPHIHRVRQAYTIEEAQKYIVEDKLATGETFGGLIAPSKISNRTYAIFKQTFERVA
jgi:hypothetical protein